MCMGCGVVKVVTFSKLGLNCFAIIEISCKDWIFMSSSVLKLGFLHLI